MSQKSLITLVLAAIVVLLGLNSYFVVGLGQQAVLVRAGAVQSASYDPGIHWRLPFVDQVALIDTRDQVSSLADVTLNKGNEAARVGAYVIWQVTDAPLYVKALGADKLRASSNSQLLVGHLQKAVNAALQQQFNGKSVAELAAGDHAKTLAALAADVGKSLHATYGIKVEHIGLLAAGWPKSARDAVYQRMRDHVAGATDKQLAQLRTDISQVKAATQAESSVALADAKRRAQLVRAAGDAKAAAIYSDAYSKSPTFYAFYRSLEAYRNSFNSKKDVLVLNADSDFFRYFKHANGALD